MERFFENAMYASRWLLAPVYFGLSLALVALTIKFKEAFHKILSANETSAQYISTALTVCKN
jgi:uncharacterized protein (TIGR00645 family)